MARPKDRDLFIRSLKECGGRASNGALKRQLGWPDPKYASVRRELLSDGIIEKGRGYGGSVLLVEGAEFKAFRDTKSETQRALAEVAESEAEIYARELDLYEPTKRQLEISWIRELELDQAHCEITALQGRRDTRGSWSRPDLVIIAYKKYEFLPDSTFELHTFEVKPQNDVTVKGVMEALAHREAATKSYVLYYTAGQEFNAYPESDRIEELASRHGVGIYAVRDVTDFDQWREVVPAQRANPDPDVIDRFIRTSLSPQAKSKLRRWF